MKEFCAFLQHNTIFAIHISQASGSESLVSEQGDQIGSVYAYWLIVYFRQFLSYKELA
jgi:hypothetical protein